MAAVACSSRSRRTGHRARGGDGGKPALPDAKGAGPGEASLASRLGRPGGAWSSAGHPDVALVRDVVVVFANGLEEKHLAEEDERLNNRRLIDPPPCQVD